MITRDSCFYNRRDDTVVVHVCSVKKVCRCLSITPNDINKGSKAYHHLDDIDYRGDIYNGLVTPMILMNALLNIN